MKQKQGLVIESSVLPVPKVIPRVSAVRPSERPWHLPSSDSALSPLVSPKERDPRRRVAFTETSGTPVSEARDGLAKDGESSADAAPLPSPLPGAPPPEFSGKVKGESTVAYFLTVHILGLLGLPKGGWFERAPVYELAMQVPGESGKKLKLRPPASPEDGGDDLADLTELVPLEQEANLQRFDERVSIRMRSRAAFFQVDVYEERVGVLELRKGSKKHLLGQCFVPLELQFNRRPCTWSIVKRGEGKTMVDVGYFICKFGLATTPGPVRNLRMGEGVTSTEVLLQWDPIESESSVALRGYHAEAQDISVDELTASPRRLADASRTAQTMPSPKPSLKLRNLHGNTAYRFRVWAVGEAGAGPFMEIMGRTGPVAPGVCGLPGLHLANGHEEFQVEWTPPLEDGGAHVVAYRVWLRMLLAGSRGDVFPAEGTVDLGLFEHSGDFAATQVAPIRIDALPDGVGCLCSVAALNAAGLTGPATSEVPVVTFATEGDSRGHEEIHPDDFQCDLRDGFEYAGFGHRDDHRLDSFPPDAHLSNGYRLDQDGYHQDAYQQQGHHGNSYRPDAHFPEARSPQGYLLDVYPHAVHHDGIFMAGGEPVQSPQPPSFVDNMFGGRKSWNAGPQQSPY